MIISNNGYNGYNILGSQVTGPYPFVPLLLLGNTAQIGGNACLVNLPDGSIASLNGSSGVILPTIFNQSVIQSYLQQISEYYLLNNLINSGTSQYAYIDSSNNVYLGYSNGTIIVGLEFLSGSTNVNKQGLLYTAAQINQTSTSFVLDADVVFFAQLTNPTVTYVLGTSNSSYSVTGYVTLDGVAGTQNSNSSTTYVQYTQNYSIQDTTIRKHEVCLYVKSSNSSIIVSGKILSVF